MLSGACRRPRDAQEIRAAALQGQGALAPQCKSKLVMSGSGKLEMSALIGSGGLAGGPDRDERERDQALGISARWEGVGAVALMEQGNCALDQRIPQIEIEGVEILGQEEPLVDDRPAGA